MDDVLTRRALADELADVRMQINDNTPLHRALWMLIERLRTPAVIAQDRAPAAPEL